MAILRFESRHTAFHLSSEESFSVERRKNVSVLTLQPRSSHRRLQLHFDRGDTLVWPNREGERMELPALGRKLATHRHGKQGLTINYPSIASCRTLILESAQAEGLLIVAPPDPGGRVTRFTLKSSDFSGSMLEIRAPESAWAVCAFEGGIVGARRALERIKKILPWPKISGRAVSARFQVQVGLIDTRGGTAVPDKKGFRVLVDIARAMRRLIGAGNILHVFGYAQGHDRGYPIYTPSARLGGCRGLRSALEGVHGEGQEAVFYLNPRIAVRECLPEALLPSILLDSRGNPFREEYNGREFVVMNPGSEAWIEYLTVQAQTLAALGADGVQLDQVAGRNALAEPGAEWGRGYLRMIERIRALGLWVWIEGLSDLYPADWFEMPHREARVCEDGSIHSGHPLGKPAMELFHLSVPGAHFLIPFVNLHNIPKDLKMKIVVDINKPKGGLFLYDADYLSTLATYLAQAIQLQAENHDSPRPRE